MLSKRFSVALNGKTYSPDFQTKPNFATQWRHVLSTNHKLTHAVCLCFGKGEKKLAIKPNNDKNDFFLARYPNTGHEHSLNCNYYSPSPERSGMQCYEAGTIDDNGEGVIRIKLERGISKNLGANQRQEPVSSRSTSCMRIPAMSLKGVLHLLWTHSGLNRWHPNMDGKRNRYVVFRELKRAAQALHVGRIALSHAFFVGADKKGSNEARDNEEMRQHTFKEGFKPLVVNMLATFREDAHSSLHGLKLLPIKAPFGIPFLVMREPLWALLTQHYSKELAAWRDGEPIVVIAQFEYNQKASEAVVLDVALMQVNSRWIPLGCELEQQLERQLYEQQRFYEKPLQFDASGDSIYPNFALLDADPKEEYPLVVFPAGSPSSTARKVLKENWFNTKHGTGWWSWDLSTHLTPPALPPINRK